jgi:hypothetical protein
MIRAVKPGGRIIVEDIDFSGHFCHPASEAFNLYLHYFVTAAKNNGQDPNIGLRLFALFDAAGVAETGYDVIQPFYNEGKGKWMAYYTMDKIKATVLKQHLAQEEDIDSVLASLEAFTNNQSSIISLPRIFRVWGVKK